MRKTTIQAETKDTSKAVSWVCRDLNVALSGKAGWGQVKKGWVLVFCEVTVVTWRKARVGIWDPKGTGQENVGLATVVTAESISVWSPGTKVFRT